MRSAGETGVMSAIRRRPWIALLGALLGGVVAYFATGTRGVYRAEALIRVPVTDVETRVELIKSDRVLAPAARKLNFPLGELERRTAVRRKGASPIIGIRVKGFEEAFSVRAANAVAQIAVNQAGEELTRELHVEREAVRTRIAQAEQSLLAAERDLQEFRRQNSRLLAMGAEGSARLEERRGSLGSDLRNMEEALRRLDGIQVRLRQSDSTAFPPLTAGNPGVEGLEQKLSSDLSRWRELQTERRRLLRTRTEEAPDVKRNEQRLTEVRAEIDHTLSILRDRYRSLARELENERSTIAQRLNQLASAPQLGHVLETLQRRVDLKSAALAEPQKRLQQLEIERAAVGDQVAVVQQARQADLEPASRWPWMLLGILSGLVVGSFIAVFAEKGEQDHMVLKPRPTAEKARAPSLAQVMEEKLGLPVLGWIPRSDQMLCTLAAPESGAAEAYRKALAAIRRALGEKGRKGFMVTSSLPREGKTALASNLAILEAQAGIKTLLIDANFRVPAIHKVFEIEEFFGLSEVLRGVHEWENMVKGVERLPALSILTSGRQVESPMDLLSSHRATLVLKNLEEEFDRIIVDAPAALPFPDALNLTSRLPTVLVHESRLDAGTALRAKSRLMESGGNLVGVVVLAAISGVEAPRADLSREQAETGTDLAPDEELSDIMRLTEPK